MLEANMKKLALFLVITAKLNSNEDINSMTIFAREQRDPKNILLLTRWVI